MVQTSVRVTQAHITAIAPNAPSAIIWQFLQYDREGSDALNEILTSHGIVTPEAIAAFLAIAAYDSQDFTTFRMAGNQILTGIVWLQKRAEHWHDLRLSITAQRNTAGTFVTCVERASWGTSNLGCRLKYWERALAAFGLEVADELHEAQIDIAFAQKGTNFPRGADAEC